MQRDYSDDDVVCHSHRGYGAGKLGYLGGDFDRQLSRLVINTASCAAFPVKHEVKNIKKS